MIFKEGFCNHWKLSVLEHVSYTAESMNWEIILENKCYWMLWLHLATQSTVTEWCGFTWLHRAHCYRMMWLHLAAQSTLLLNDVASLGCTQHTVTECCGCTEHTVTEWCSFTWLHSAHCYWMMWLHLAAQCTLLLNVVASLCCTVHTVTECCGFTLLHSAHCYWMM
jgi:hypothetical protein